MTREWQQREWRENGNRVEDFPLYFRHVSVLPCFFTSAGVATVQYSYAVSFYDVLQFCCQLWIHTWKDVNLGNGK